MEWKFWHDKWHKKDIGFHEGAVNPLLSAHFDCIKRLAHQRVFLPLCGKTRDIAWLLEQGCRVVGSELSEVAVNELFEELRTRPEIVSQGGQTWYRADNLDIHLGDVFHLCAAALGEVDVIYDRAALVALPADWRPRYASQLAEISRVAPQLVITFEYQQSQMPGPPFSVNGDELRSLYAGQYQVQALTSRPVAGGLKGQVAAQETIWRLQPLPDVDQSRNK